MKITYLLASLSCLVCLESSAGIQDYIVYDQKSRHHLDEVDGIVTVKINKYYAFADIGLVKTVVEERKRIELRPIGVECRRSSIRTHCGKETIHDSGPGKNEVLQVLRNTLWLLEAEITEVYSGSFNTNKIYIAIKPTRAYLYEELPQNFLSNPATNSIDFGLIRLDEDEFKKSFRGLICYLNNDLRLLDGGFVENLDEPLSFTNDYFLFFKEFTPTPCYVAREIGIHPKAEAGVDCPQESKLLQSLKRGQEKDPSTKK